MRFFPQKRKNIYTIPLGIKKNKNKRHKTSGFNWAKKAFEAGDWLEFDSNLSTKL